MNRINVSTQNKSTSIRLSERTKRMLESLAKGKETHEQILQRLIRMASLLDDSGYANGSGYGGGSASGAGYADGTGDGTSIGVRDNIVATQYARLSTTLEIDWDTNRYEIVCTYNDLSPLVLLRSRRLRNVAQHGNSPNNVPPATLDWEIGLEIVNVNRGEGWTRPSALSERERTLLYLVCVRQVLEDTFNVKLYELETEDDYQSQMKWTKAYNRNNLSKVSLRSDILKALQ